jgi:phosphoribosyl 1,2-cyclic phosphodiesterase
MAAEPVFAITYWGATGTLSAPLKPVEVTDKIVRAIQQLVEQGRLADLRPGPALEATIRRHVEAALPFHVRSTYGGNTTCLEVQTPDALLILDSGTGFRELGTALGQRWNAPGYQGPRTAHVLVTHPHMDHTLATPYFAPYYDPRNHLSLWGSRSVLESYRAVLDPASPLSRLYFPPTLDLLKALKSRHEVQPGEAFAIGSTHIRTYALHHPGECLAYRLENSGRVFVFATDHEHQEVPDQQLAAFARGADLFYTEGQYLAAEYEGRQAIPGELPLPRRGWGHSPIEACVATAVAAQVRTLHIGHREPMRRDDDIAALEQYLQQQVRDELRRAGRDPEGCTACIPHEGMTVRL